MGSLDSFRQEQIHTRFGKAFLDELELARAYGRSPFDPDDPSTKGWGLWREMLTAAGCVARRYPIETSPAFLVELPPLSDLTPALRIQLREKAQQAFERETDVNEQCRRLAIAVNEIEGRAEAIDAALDVESKCRMLDELLPDVRSLFEALEELEYGVWIP